MTWICKNCRIESDDTVEVCWKCGYNKAGIPVKVEQGDVISSKQRYPALITISNLLGIFAWVIVAISVILSIYIFGEEGIDGLFSIIYILIGAVITTISLLAFSGLIKLLIDIEKNTRSKSS